MLCIRRHGLKKLPNSCQIFIDVKGCTRCSNGCRRAGHCHRSGTMRIQGLQQLSGALCTGSTMLCREGSVLIHVYHIISTACVSVMQALSHCK
jgi:hypothetical protein